MLIDTHCHLHDSEFYPDNREQAYKESVDAGVVMVCVGTDERSSREAVEFAATHSSAYAVVGVHPHEAVNGWAGIAGLLAMHRDSIIGIGEIGLDYYYDHSPKELQHEALRAQIQLAIDYDLPISFHVRDAFDDFWPVFDSFQGVRGVLHSFTDSQQNLDAGLERGLFIGINGISTFTKDVAQRELYASIPLERVLLETDAPFLTPAPFRGKMNIPAYVSKVAEVQADTRHISLGAIRDATTANAQKLFGI